MEGSMTMNEFLFYWIVWLFVIIHYFFNDNKKMRDRNVIILLFLLISSHFVIPFFSFSFNGAWFIIAIIAFQYVVKLNKKEKIYLYFISACISSLYLFIHYFIFFEPVWLYVTPITAITTIVTFICILFIKKYNYRFVALAIGFVQGDLVQSIILWKNGHPAFETYVVGDFSFLAILAISLFVIFFWNSFENMINKIKRNKFSKYIPRATSRGKANM